MAGGRPLKFKTTKQLKEAIDGYFESCMNEEGEIIRPFTVTGLALALDTTRETLLDYEERDGFSDTIKAAKQRIHNYAEEYLFVGKNQTGAIFNLKNNWGWKDQQNIDHTTDGKELPTPIIPLHVQGDDSDKENNKVNEED